MARSKPKAGPKRPRPKARRRRAADPERLGGPTPEQLRLLTPVERAGYRLGDFVSRRLRPLATFWSHVVIGAVAWAVVSRRARVFGLEHLQGLDGRHKVILVSNHRTFFDFFVIGALTFRYSRLPRRSYFPVRAPFFYSNPAGVLLNLLGTGMSMFPPILRDPARMAFNPAALDRLGEELRRGAGVKLGLHPEGTRNKGPDPYALLPARPGVGRVILAAPPDVRVIPLFILGLTPNLGRELWRNGWRPRRHPVHLFVGAPLDFSDLRAGGARAAQQLRASRRCLKAIAALGELERAERRRLGLSPPGP